MLVGIGCRVDYLVGWVEEQPAEGETNDGGNRDTVGGDDDSVESGDTTGADDAGLEGTAGSGDTTGVGFGDTDTGSDDTMSPGECALDPPEPDGSQCLAPNGYQDCDFDDDLLKVIGLDCSTNLNDSIPLLFQEVDIPDPSARRFVQQFGNPNWDSTSPGVRFLALSTGSLSEPDGLGLLTEAPSEAQLGSGNNGNPDGVMLPDRISTDPGSNGGAGGDPFICCDGSGDCSDTLSTQWQNGGAAQDLASFAFNASVPIGTYGWRVDLAFLTAEFPEKVDAADNDTFVWWVDSEAFVGNIATFNGEPMTVTGLRPRLVGEGRTGDHPSLLGTGFDGYTGESCEFSWASYPDCPVGAATSWMTLVGPAVPGELLKLTVALFDQGDPALDTVVLMDTWRWRCEGCTPGEDCGVGDYIPMAQ